MGDCDRIESNQVLELSGLTLSAIQEMEAKEAVSIPVMVMLRPKTGGFHCIEAEFHICRDAELFVKLDVDGLVFDFLNADGAAKEERIRTLVEISYDRETVFSRAIDVCRGWHSVLERCIDAGVNLVMTSADVDGIVRSWNNSEHADIYPEKDCILPVDSICLENALEVSEAPGV